MKLKITILKNTLDVERRTAEKVVELILTLVSSYGKGAQGDPGERGERGIPGLNGQNGKDGVDGKDGKNGTDGQNGAKGDKGDPLTYADLTSAQIAELQKPATDAAEGLLARIPDEPYSGKVLVSSGGNTSSWMEFDPVMQLLAYGIEWDSAISSPVCTRIGNSTLHRTLPIQSRMRRCLLLDDGTVNYYLDANDSTKKADGTPAGLTGADGQVMVEIPEHYRRFEVEGTKHRVKISEYPLDGYHLVPKKYVSAYEATLERSTGKLCSVVNTGVDYRGGNNTDTWDGTYRSLLGRPSTNKNRTEFRAAARARGAGTQWNCLDYNVHKDIVWLYCIEYANLNSQAPFDAQKDANGYAQGGLGEGVTTMVTAEWNTYNAYNPFIPCGHTDALGNASGEVAYDMPSSGGGVFRTVKVPRYRGIENIFGHLWKWADGISVEVTAGVGNTSRVYVCDDPAKYNDNNYTGYEMRGLEARDEGYVREVIFGESGDIIPTVAGGGSTTYWCDYHYTSVMSSSMRGVLFGGHAAHGTNAGLAASYSGNTPPVSSVNLGARLCFIPSQNQ